jgi:undecaprenyl-diphosphatase
MGALARPGPGGARVTMESAPFKQRWTRRATRLYHWLRDHNNLLVLIVALLVVGGVWGFVEIAAEVMEGDTQRFDEWAVRALRMPDPEATPDDPRPQVPVGPKWLREVGRDMTALGGVAVLALVTAGVAGYLLMVRKYHAMWLVLVATGGGLVASTVLKYGFDRPRPEVDHYSHVYTSSFPSGHSMLSAVVYLTLGSLMTRLVPERHVKVYLIVVALLLTMLVGVSRVYMGVHYPTDVLAGWTAGLVWAMVCWLAARYLQKRGAVEKDTEQSGKRGFEPTTLTPPRAAAGQAS